MQHALPKHGKHGRRKKQPLAANVLFLDIETAPLEAYVWGLWKQNVGLKFIKADFTILSFSMAWLNDDKVYHFNTGGKGVDKVRDDRFLCEVLWHALDKADIVVVQNGKSFDIPKINTRMFGYGMGPYSPIKIVDTKLVAKKHFGFSSNALAYMTDRYCTVKKREHEKFPGFELWLAMLRDDPEGWKECRLYNDDDVASMKELYLKMLPWIEGHPNVAAYENHHDVACPKCGSKHVVKRGIARTQTQQYQRYQCADCGGWSRGRYTVAPLAKRKSLLSN